MQQAVGSEARQEVIGNSDTRTYLLDSGQDKKKQKTQQP